MGTVPPLKVRVHPSLLLWFSALFYLNKTILLPFLFAAAAHEVGHYLALWQTGHPPNVIQLGFFGAKMETGILSYRQELVAAAAGPAANLALCVFLPFWPAFGFYNAVLGLVNLLPIPGLDGEKVLRCALALRFPAPSAQRFCQWAAIVTALAVWGFAMVLSFQESFGIWPLFAAAVLLYRALCVD